jgi:hypothetical protein
MGRVDYERPPMIIRRWLIQVTRTTLADHWRERYRLFTYSLEQLLEFYERALMEEELGGSNTTRIPRLQQLLRARLSISPSPEECRAVDREEPAAEHPAAGDSNHVVIKRFACITCMLTSISMSDSGCRHARRHQPLRQSFDQDPYHLNRYRAGGRCTRPGSHWHLPRWSTSQGGTPRWLARLSRT